MSIEEITENENEQPKSPLWLRILKHYIFLSVIAAALLLIIAFFTTRWALDSYTQHGKTYAVPDLYGIPLDEATDILQKQGMIAVLFDSLYSTEVAPGAVYVQTPTAGTLVKRNRKIYLTVNATGVEMRIVPNLIGLTLRRAQAIIEENDFKIAKKTYIPDISTDYVLEQQFEGSALAAGIKLPKGSAIDLILGGGLSSERVVVPNVVGMTLEDAKATLKPYYLHISGTEYEGLGTSPTKQDSLNSRIYEQVPRAGERIQKGDILDVYLRAYTTAADTTSNKND